MRDLGYGHITILGIPAGSTVKAAFLLWDVLDDSQQPADASGAVNGTAVTGQLVGSGPTPCWPAAGNYSYEADVTSLISGNGSYSLTGFASGATDGSDPWYSGSPTPELEGASLVVIYANQASPDVFVSLAGGAQEGGSLSASFSGFTAANPVSAKTTFIVADGQSSPDGPATFNGTALQPGDFQGSDPQDVPAYSQGNLWDTATYDVSSLIQPGGTSATATIDGTEDCLVWVGQAMSVTMGSSNPSCPSLTMIAARGSGELPQNNWADPSTYAKVSDQGVGHELDDLYTRLSTAHPGLVLEPVVYPASKVWDLVDGHFKRYLSSVATGTSQVLADIKLTDSACGSSMHHYVLGGYSQGAWVIHDALSKLSPKQLREISGVALFGDPDFVPFQPWVRAYKLLDVSLGSSVAIDSAHTGIPAAVIPHTASYCFPTDPVCQANPFNIQNFLPECLANIKLLCPHLQYVMDGKTAKAAKFLIPFLPKS